MKPLPLAAGLVPALVLALTACSQQEASPPAEPSDSATQSNAAAETLPTETQAVVEPVAQPTAAAPRSTALAPEGLGDIVVGKAPPASLRADNAQVSDACRTYTDKARRLYAMVEDKVVTRITAMQRSKVATAAGIAPGASEAQVRKAYPDAVETPHKYVDAPAKYLDWRPGAGDAGLRFEIDAEGKVSAIHAGREPAIEYVEGCA